MAFTFMRPDENMVYGGTVTTSAGTTDSTYTDDWLVDGRGRPVRATNGTVTWAITGPSAKNVDTIVVHSHTIDAARTITIGGGVSATLSGPTARSGGAPNYNPWGTCTLTSTDSVTVGVSSNSVAVVIGEVLAGRRRTLDRDLPMDGFDIEYQPLNVGTPSRFGSVPKVDLFIEARRLTVSSMIVSATERDLLIGWWESARNDTRPSVVIPFPLVQDAWVVSFVAFRYRPRGNNLWTASMVFEEWPRTRWIPS